MMNYAIIAAGEGSRLAQEGVALPKPLVRLDGVPMVRRLIDIMCRCNAASISIIVNETMTQVQDYIRSLQLPVPLHVVVKSTPSSMHSLWELHSVMPAGRFCLTTVDTIFREDDFARYIAAFEASDADGLWAVTPFVDDEKPLYVSTDEQMRITAFLDQRPERVQYVSGGVYAMDDKAWRVLDHCIATGQSRMRNFQRALLAAGLDLRAYSIDKIIDVDHASDIAVAERFIKAPSSHNKH